MQCPKCIKRLRIDKPATKHRNSLERATKSKKRSIVYHCKICDGVFVCPK